MAVDSLHALVASHLHTVLGERLTPSELAKKLIERFPHRFAEKEKRLNGRSSLEEQLTREIYSRKDTILARCSGILVDTSVSPIRFFAEKAYDVQDDDSSKWRIKKIKPSSDTSSRQGIVEARGVCEDIESMVSLEKELYRPIQQYLFHELGVVSKRIREATSSNRRGKNGNKWLHPDVVGMLVPGRNWCDEINGCAAAFPARRAIILSIEVKRELTMGNIRERFFQAVSNSLWANRAYIAASRVNGAEVFDELNMLCALHGVGYISIQEDNFHESRVLIPARERLDIDWASANRIAEENNDFKGFINCILNYLKTGCVENALWDHV